jgi:hypothetical protein
VGIKIEALAGEALSLFAAGVIIPGGMQEYV